jgi:hypothetical protein
MMTVPSSLPRRQIGHPRRCRSKTVQFAAAAPLLAAGGDGGHPPSSSKHHGDGWGIHRFQCYYDVSQAVSRMISTLSFLNGASQSV